MALIRPPMAAGPMLRALRPPSVEGSIFTASSANAGRATSAVNRTKCLSEGKGFLLDVDRHAGNRATDTKKSEAPGLGQTLRSITSKASRMISVLLRLGGGRLGFLHFGHGEDPGFESRIQLDLV